MPKTFNESRLRFSFGDSWQVFQYDACSFFKNQVEPALKKTTAVDFVGLRGTLVFLLEVKNFGSSRST